MGVLAALVIAEGLSRLFLPVFAGAKRLSLEGEELDIRPLQPGVMYRQLSEEYDALVTITQGGYRVPEARGGPEIIFLGDSFTFGQGLSDDETFAYVFCATAQVSCANLGVPGASTIDELDRLEKFLSREAWHPKHVFLFMLAMSQFMGAGNDFYDNLKTYEESDRSAALNGPSPNFRNSAGPSTHNRVLSWFVAFGRSTLKYSNLSRVVKFRAGPQIKNLLAPAPGEEKLNKSLSITKEQLLRLESLAQKYDFEYHIFLIHPVQDISRGSHQDTYEKLQSISPKAVIPTAQLFQPSPGQYYYQYDGHLNPMGSEKIANYLLSEYEDFTLDGR